MLKEPNSISDLIFQNGNASLKDLFPLTEVKTETDKATLAAEGYNPGFTLSEWPYELPKEHIFYSKQLFPGTYYYEPNNSVIPIVINLNIHGAHCLPIIKDKAEFYKHILHIVESLRTPSLSIIYSYLISLDDGFRSEVLAEYIRRSKPSSDLYEIFTSVYTVTDYGAGAYDSEILKKVFSGRSEEQISETVGTLADFPDVVSIYRGEAEGSTPYHKAFSWTVDINTAFFFACRHGDHDHARIIRAKVKKTDIMAALLDRGEKEVIVLPGTVFDVSKEKLIGPNAISQFRYLKEYHEGR